jgi:hypothetical protein
MVGFIVLGPVPTIETGYIVGGAGPVPPPAGFVGMVGSNEVTTGGLVTTGGGVTTGVGVGVAKVPPSSFAGPLGITGGFITTGGGVTTGVGVGVAKVPPSSFAGPLGITGGFITTGGCVGFP